MEIIKGIFIIILISIIVFYLVIGYYQDRKKEFHVEFPITFKYNFFINFDGDKLVRIGITNNN